MEICVHYNPFITVKLFSHDVSNLEPTFQFLNHLNAILPQTNTVDSTFMYHEFWETRYILLLWISLICMIPFDLKNVDSGAHDQVITKSKKKLFTVIAYVRQ